MGKVMRLRKRAYIVWIGPASRRPELGGEEAAGAEEFLGEVLRQGVAHGVVIVGRVAEAEGTEGLGGDAAGGEVLAGACGFGGFELGFEVPGGGLVEVEQLAAQASFAGLFGRGELALGQRDAGLLRDGADGLGKVRPSIFMTKVKTSPFSWQPKQ